MDDPKVAEAVRSSADDAVPVFGTWTRIYIAVVLSNLIAIALSAAFTRFPY